MECWARDPRLGSGCGHWHGGGYQCSAWQPRRASSLKPQLAELGNGLLVSVSQDIAFCRVFRSDLYLSLTEVSHLYKSSNGGVTSRSPAPLLSTLTRHWEDS